VRGMADALDRLAPAEEPLQEDSGDAASEPESPENQLQASAPPAAAPRTEER